MSLPISSANNDRLRWLRRLLKDRRQRRREGLWVAEGVRLAEEVLRCGLEPRLWVVEQGWEEKGARELALVEAVAAQGVPLLRVSRGLLRELSDTLSPQGILVAFAAPRWELQDLLSAAGPVVVLDRLQDPGNLGTIARIAEGAGAAGLVLTPGTADLGNLKALRASAGALLRLPALRVEGGVAEFGAAAGRQVLATSGEQGTPYDQADLRGPFTLLLGQEGSGLAPGLMALAGEQITIPMSGGLESLNVASAAAVVLFEAARQRRTARLPS